MSSGGIPPSALILGTAKNATVIHTVRAEISTESILERAGQVIFKTFLLELIVFRPIPVLSPARGAAPENYWEQ